MSDEKDAIKKLMDTCEANGVSVTSVKDGHVLAFKRSFLQKELNKLKPDQEKFVIFVQQPKSS